jgi:hypothetical protein
MFEEGDKNKDGALTLAELKEMPRPPERTGQGATEHFMPDLDHPEEKGKQMDPVFFVGNLRGGKGKDDLDRRRTIAKFITDPKNPWFAKAFVNRVWSEPGVCRRRVRHPLGLSRHRQFRNLSTFIGNDRIDGRDCAICGGKSDSHPVRYAFRRDHHSTRRQGFSPLQNG